MIKTAPLVLVDDPPESVLLGDVFDPPLALLALFVWSRGGDVGIAAVPVAPPALTDPGRLFRSGWVLVPPLALVAPLVTEPGDIVVPVVPLFPEVDVGGGGGDDARLGSGQLAPTLKSGSTMTLITGSKNITSDRWGYSITCWIAWVKC